MGYTALTQPMQRIDPNMFAFDALAPSSPNFGVGAGAPLGIGASQIGMTNPMLQQQLEGLTANGAPTMPGAGGGLFAGMNGMDTAKLALGGLQTIGSLWGAFQSAKMAKKQFNFTKDITETNLANQIRSYNTQLEDRSRSRAVMEGQSAAQAQDYIDRNKAVRR